ncbi:hypothetical protein RB614_40345 [Phytohabitans sp. ZYX-F-186]|uniref:Uncharacterized protein n=1 Tax=Phytohabitans maris TaxID=3071409 RepID=A0ABU0ZX24_9ACTN|nr:hypothetical protein [Phytohabitans sp. ZYX-F-186]MDQ7910760.1 hypothetical protein [Phytohabitans sp. ZYX-F-186]
MTKPGMRPHPFELDDDLSTEYVTSDRREAGPRGWCRRCGLPGEPGDARHSAREVQRLADAAELDRRRLGERVDDEDQDVMRGRAAA